MYIHQYETTIGAALSPPSSSSFSQDCQNRVKRENAQKKSRVAVVGSGLAGLMAARWLGQFGFDVTVFEARNQVGGRVLSNTTFSNGRITEEGAELVGSFHTTWLGLAREYGLAMISRMDPDLYERAGLRMKLRLGTDRDLSMDAICQLGKDMDAVLENIARDASQIRDPVQPWLDFTLKGYDNMSVADALEKTYQVKRDDLLWKALQFQLVNDEVAPLDEMNFLGLLCKVKGGQQRGQFCDDEGRACKVKDGQRGQFCGDYDPGRARLMRYWDELEIFRCADGCQTLARKLDEDIKTNYGAKLLLSTAVTSIDIHTKKCAYKGTQTQGRDLNKPCVVLGAKQVNPNGKLANTRPTFTLYDYVILAIPPSVWKDVTITVDGKSTQPDVMGMDPAVKFFSDVKERFWIKKGNAPCGGSLKLGQVWEGTDNQTRVAKQGIVLSVFAGPIIPRDPLKPRGPGRAPTKREMQDELEKLYPGGYTSNLNKTLFKDWPAEPFIETGYASPRLGQIFTVGKKLNEPFHDLLFFAGEHTRMDFFGYMEGALRSGEDAAMKLMLQSCGLLKTPAPASPSPQVWTASAAPIRGKTASKQ